MSYLINMTKTIFYYLIGILGIILISCIPNSIKEGLSFDWRLYVTSIKSVIIKLLNPDQWYFNRIDGVGRVTREPIIAFIKDDYPYVMTILCCSLLLALLLGFVFSFLTFLLPKKIQWIMIKILNILEGFPDVLFILLVQMFAVWSYQTTGLKLFDFIYLGNEKIYFAPIISLSILPTIMFYKIIMLLLERELAEDYVQLAKSKGLKQGYLLAIHCLRNIKNSLFHQSKSVVWACLSSLFIIEYFFSLNGILNFILFDSTPFVIAFAMILVFSPFFLFYEMVEILVIQNGHDMVNRSFSKLTPLFSKSDIRMLIEKIGKDIVSAYRSFIALLRRPISCVALLFVIGMVVVSVLYPHLKEPPIKEMELLYDDNGKLLSVAPHPPSSYFLLGSDRYGYSIFDQIMVGAKYTIIFSLLIALLRVVISYLLAFPYLFFVPITMKKWMAKLANGMQFLSFSLVAYILIQPVVTKDAEFPWHNTFTERVIFEVIILVIFVLPMLLNIIGNEMDQLMDKEFILAAQLMGTSNVRLFINYITPNVFPSLVNLFRQQVIQVLFVFIHLGALSVFFGGTIRNVGAPPQSFTNEWAGVLSLLKEGLMTNRYWLILPTLLAYLLFIFSVQMITSAIISHEQSKVGIFKW
ncbi:hypothetical protein [Aquibacillus kalidii]|uniref:hypothetical protein n=1 Tax=Aquibacillus kalidii TaxID=2762597 RepID=UPI001648B5C5|nr:hypothetical protein [Aquibacillus kalidii]